MNERIYELAKDVGHYVKTYWTSDDNYKTLAQTEHYMKDPGLEKFAELIIKECIQFRTVLTQFDGTTPYGDGYENGLRDMAEVIAEHFGVEE